MIHPTAIIDAKAELASDVEVGPYSIIGAGVKIDSGTRVGPHVVINGETEIGKNNRIFQFASIGEENQDKKYAGEPTRTIIGDNNTFRESCTVHRGTTQDLGYTQIGSDCLFMAYTHVAHDCIIGDHVIFANSATAAGHVKVGNWVILGGFTGIHQFCKIGDHVFAGINSRITQDVPPYVMLHDSEPRAINSEGLKRRGFSAEQIRDVKNAYRALYRKGLKLEQAIAEIAAISSEPHIQVLVDFIRNSERGIVR